MDEPLSIRKAKTTQLNAWPLVSSILFDLTATSDEVVFIIDRAGLSVDWNLTPKEDYSHSTRKRAYRPRVQTAYSSLAEGDRDTVLTNIAGELVRRHPEQSQNIKAAFSRIGWTLTVAQSTEQATENSRLSMKRDKELQRLLLLQVRDGKEPPELGNYPEQQQVHNAALLIKDGYVEGQAIEDGSGVCVGTVMTALTSKGHDYLEQTEDPNRASQEPTSPAQAPSFPPAPGADPGPSKTAKLIFISHSSLDKELADALVDMLCVALHLRRSDFLCTSVEGAKLRGGDQTDAVLRRAIREVPAFLSLLTPMAVASTYVLFELGARWGNEKHHIPLLAKGAGPREIKDPLKATNALQLSEETDVLQLVDDLAPILDRQPEPANSYLKKAQKVTEISRAGAAVTESKPNSDSKEQSEGQLPTLSAVIGTRRMINEMGLSEAAKKLLTEAADSTDGNVWKSKSDAYGELVNIHTQNQEFLGKPEDKRARALWLHAFDELVRAGCFEPTSTPGCYRVTHIAYELAEFLKRQ